MNVQTFAAVGSIAAVTVAVVTGLLVAGSPAEQRLLRLDDRRVSDLRQLSSAAQFQWEQNQTLPAASAALVDGRYLSRLPADPAGQSYEYRATGPRAFEVCAVFGRPSRPELAGDFWFHEAGRKCFPFDVTESRR